jgi:tetratricopeptide (TPR) repeat protein
MDTKQKFLLITTLLACVLGVQENASADICDDLFEKGTNFFNSAYTASQNQDYSKAINLYNQSINYYSKVLSVSKCNCPKIKNSSRSNINKSKENIDIVQKNSNASKSTNAYNRAVSLFKKGNEYARNKQWFEAAQSFDEAEELWRNVDTSSTVGQQAQQGADKARELAELARQQM